MQRGVQKGFDGEERNTAAWNPAERYKWEGEYTIGRQNANWKKRSAKKCKCRVVMKIHGSYTYLATASYREP